MTRPLAIARLDAGRDIGLGHLVRCRAVLDQLGRLGWQRAIAVNAEAAAIDGGADLVVAEGDDVAALRRRWPDGCALLIVDHYRRDRAFEGALRGWATRILAIDDLADRPHDADLLLDQTPGRRPEDYAALVPADCRLLLGGEHALLRPQFQARRPAGLARRRDGAVERILVSFGGTDPGNITGRAVAAIAAANYTGALDVVLGAAAPHADGVAAALAPFGDRARLHRAVADMGGLMAMADLAVGAAGVSSWERCALALPAVAIAVVDNQRSCAAALAAAGAAVVTDEAGLCGALRHVLGDGALRRQMAVRAGALCDGRGLQRLALALLPPMLRDGSAVTLRLAGEGDADMMLAWQGAPGVRRYARTAAVPTKAEHMAWLARVLGDPGRWLMMIELNGRPAGILRLDTVAERGFEVSILVDPACQGQGVAGRALALGAMLCPGAALLAEVDPANEASRTLFARAGYVRQDERHWEWRGLQL